MLTEVGVQALLNLWEGAVGVACFGLRQALAKGRSLWSLSCLLYLLQLWCFQIPSKSRFFCS